MTDCQINLTSFGGTDPNGVFKTMSYDEFSDKLTNPKTYPDKKSCPGFSVAQFKDNYRHGNNLISVGAVTADYDAGMVGIEEAYNLLKAKHITAILYTTASHTEDKPKWRVVCPLSETVDRERHRELTGALNGVLGGIIAKESFEPDRFFFWGKVEGKTFKSFKIDGGHIDHFDDLCEELPRIYPVNLPTACNDSSFDDSSLFNQPLTDEQKHDIKLALDYLAKVEIDPLDNPNNPHWVDAGSNWTGIGYDLKAVHPDDLEWAYDTYKEWSSKSIHYDEDELNRRWEQFKPSRTGIASIFKKAQDLGWINPASKSKQPKVKGGFEQFSLKGKIDIMRKELDNQSFVIDGLAVAGQITTFYAEPNAGKTLLTLKLLCESIDAGRVCGDSVFYINADDNARGLIDKQEIVDRYRFNQLCPGREGFEAKMLVPIMQNHIDDGTAKGTIIILDTLKKFADIMDKKASTEFMSVSRAFVSNGGTVILLAHTNKVKGKDGKSIYAGTADVLQDTDTAFTINVVGTQNDRKTVIFEQNKARGMVEASKTFSYSITPKQSYQALFNSVQCEHSDHAEKIKEETKRKAQLDLDLPLIKEINAVLEVHGGLNVRELRNKVKGRTDRIGRVLDNYEGHPSARWEVDPNYTTCKMYKYKVAIVANDDFDTIEIAA